MQRGGASIPTVSICSKGVCAVLKNAFHQTFQFLGVVPNQNDVEHDGAGVQEFREIKKERKRWTRIPSQAGLMQKPSSIYI